MIINIKVLLLILLTSLFLNSCSNTRILVEGTKKIIIKEDKSKYKKDDNESNFTKGHFKIGKPYIVDGIKYFPEMVSAYEKEGLASWYGPNFDKKLTANGEIFDQNIISAAHKTLPLPSIVKVTNLNNNKSLYIRVNDRGPFVNDRIIDLSKEAAIKLNIYSKGVEKVKVKLLDTGPHLLNTKYIDHLYLTNYSKKKDVDSLKNLEKKQFYLIQLAAFSDLDNAKKFIIEVKKKIGRETQYKKMKILNPNKLNSLYKIVLGPFSKDKQLKIVADKLLELGYNFIIIGNKDNI